MKIWAKVHIKDKDKQIDQMTHSLTNYLYSNGPIIDIYRKYNLSKEDKKALNEYTANRIAGILMLYLSKDYKRINDIINKYNIDNSNLSIIFPEIEGYIEK